MMKRKNSKKFLLSRLIILIVLVVTNTFAWFIYATKIDSSVQVHVKSWKVVFEANDNEVTNIVNVDVDSIYPGMEDYEYNITAYNRSEVPASISYEILEVRIFNDVYVSQEGRVYNNQSVQQGDLTSNQLEYRLSHDYPFTISMGTSDSSLEAGTGAEDFTIEAVWPYESNHDDVDTLWGINANNYKESHPNDSSITLTIKISITQSAS